MKPIKIVVPYKIPSLNQVLKWHWRRRHQESRKTQLALYAALKAIESDLLIQMRSSENGWWMRSGTADCSPAIRLGNWITRSDKLKSHRNPLKELKSK